jgi:hypothetical protein
VEQKEKFTRARVRGAAPTVPLRFSQRFHPDRRGTERHSRLLGLCGLLHSQWLGIYLFR